MVDWKLSYLYIIYRKVLIQRQLKMGGGVRRKNRNRKWRRRRRKKMKKGVRKRKMGMVLFG